MRKHYIALVHKDDETGFGVSFPDFPGAATAAPTLDQAVERAARCGTAPASLIRLGRRMLVRLEPRGIVPAVD
jgi:hypothetical protein